jgi:hypothetical protein
MYWKILANDRWEVSSEIACNFFPVLEVETTEEVDDSSLLFMVLGTRQGCSL